jgi:hypothetical protein
VRKLRFALGAVAALVQLTVAIALVVASNSDTHPWRTAIAAGTAGLSFIVAGLVALWRRPGNGTSFLLAATGYLWFIGALTESNNSWVWTVGFVLQNLSLVAFAALILAYPDGRLSRRDAWLVGFGGGSSETSSARSSTATRRRAHTAPAARSRSRKRTRSGGSGT